MNPGRIQTVDPVGYYSANANKPLHLTNGSFYLVDNPNYTYRWVDFDGASVPGNAVPIRNDVGPMMFLVTRVKVNGHMQIGKFTFPLAAIPDDGGRDSYYQNYEILVCDPWPKYQCGEFRRHQIIIRS
jgi:hypothetical protein